MTQQISGALGLAVLSTLAANHTRGLIAAHEGHISALLGGYQMAFLIGAAAIATGIVLVLVLLRQRDARPALQVAPDEVDTFITHEFERLNTTTTHVEYPTRPAERPSRNRGERFAVPAFAPWRTGMVSEVCRRQLPPRAGRARPPRPRRSQGS